MNLFSMLQHVGAVVPLVGALLLLSVMNVPRARRHQQFALPGVAVLFAIVALIVLYRFNVWFDGVLAWVFSLVPFMEGLYQTRWLYIIENTAVVLVFFGLKALYGQIAGRLFTGDRFPGSVLVDQIYEYDAASGRWYVRPRLSQLRMLLGVLYAVSLVVTALLVVAMTAAPAWPGFSAIGFPAIAVLVLGEVHAAINGVTQQEGADQITGERDLASRRANYASLRTVFRSTFPEHVIDEGVDMANPRVLSSRAALTELGSSEDGVERLFAEHFERVARGGALLDENLLHASVDLLRGRSVVFNTPFYVDLTEYLALPAYVRLLRGGKTLLVTGRDAAAGDLVEWFSDGLEQISGVPDLWHIEVLGDETRTGLDVGVLRAADLHNLRLLEAHDEFFRDVETVILLEPSRLLATGQLGLGIVVSRLSRGEHPVYVSIDRNHDGLVDALSHLLKVNLTDVVATQPALGASSEMVWAAENAQLSVDILPGVARYLGLGTELAAVALKYHVAQVEWIGGARFPVIDMSWIAGQYFGKITGFAELEPSQRALSGVLRARANPLDLPRAERRFLIVEDEFSNVYESLRLFASRSTESGFIHLVSDDYLLRDYMVDNRELFSTDPKAIPSIVADYARTPRNAVLRLVLMLSAFPMPEATIRRELELSGWQISEEAERAELPATLVALEALIRRYVGVSDVQIIEERVRHRASAEVDSAGAAERRYRLHGGAALDDVVRGLGAAYFLVEDEQAGRDFIGGCLQGHVAQTVLPGQFLTLGGKYYEVLTVGGEGRPAEVLLRRAAEHITGRPAYRNLRSFAITEVRSSDRAAPRAVTEDIVAERVVVSMTVESHGYLALPARSDLAGARRVAVAGLEPRRYVEKDAMRIAMPTATAEVRRTIAVLLNEVFVTVFPDGHPFVVALAPDLEQAAGDLLPHVEVDDDEAIYIVEDSSVDLGLVIAVERNWERLLQIVTDYLHWAVSPRPVVAPEPDHDTVVFPGESTDEARERIRRAQEEPETDAGREGWWPRVRRRISERVRRRPADDADSEGEGEDDGASQ